MLPTHAQSRRETPLLQHGANTQSPVIWGDPIDMIPGRGDTVNLCTILWGGGSNGWGRGGQDIAEKRRAWGWRGMGNGLAATPPSPIGQIEKRNHSWVECKRMLI